MKKYHYGYKITNKQSGKYYYGVHSTDNLEDGYFGSGIALRKAIQKEGKEFFSKEIVKTFKSRQEALDWERELVTESLISDKNCYNLKTGGENTVEYSDESRKRMSASHKGRKLSEETKRKMSKSRTGRKLTPEQVEAIRERMRGKHYSRESVQKSLETRKKNGWHQQRESVRLKNSLAHRGKPSGTAGKVRLFREDVETLVRKEDLQEYLAQGWIRGRNPEVGKQIGRSKLGKPSKLKGIPRSPRDREVISKAKKGMVSPSLGKIWINKEGKSTLVFPSVYKAIYEKEGWQLGRKCN